MMENSTMDEKTFLRSKRIELRELLGKGAFAEVRRALFTREDGTVVTVAVKIVDLKKMDKKFFERELEIMQGLDQPNIICCYDMFQNGPKYYIVQEYCSKGDMLDYIKLRRTLKEGDAKKMMRQIMEGLKYLHSKEIIHRDVKLENLLLGNDGTVKLADFAFARKMTATDTSNTYCGSAVYAAPEILMGRPYTGLKCDIWSAGIVLFTLLFGKMPFDDSNVVRLLRDQQTKTLEFPRTAVSEDAKDLLKKMIEPMIHQRPTAREVLNHRWFTAGIPEEHAN